MTTTTRVPIELLVVRFGHVVKKFSSVHTNPRKNASGSSTGRHSLRPARDGRDAGTRDLDQPERQHQRHKLLDLVALAGDLKYEAFGGGVDHPGAEGVGQPQRLDPVLALALDLDHGELALDRAASERHVHH